MRTALRGFTASLALVLAVAALLAPSAFAKAGEIAYRCSEVDICLIDPDNPGAITNLTANGSTTNDREPAWSPDGKRVAFVSHPPATGAQNIFVMTPDAPDQGNNLAVQLTFLGYDGATISDLAWSPDGTKIAYRREFGGTRSVFVVAADGSTLTPLLIDTGGKYPAWSPDGGKIAYSKGEQVYTTNADGSNAIAPLVNGAGEDPSWSPDGSRISFEGVSSQGFGYDDIHIVPSPNAAGNPLVIPAHQNQWNYAAWSPDGGRLAYRSDCATAEDCIRVVRADGGGDIPLAALPDVRAYNGPHSWSPDGTRIAFEGYAYKAGGTYEIYVVKADGTGAMVPVTSGGKNYEPDWRPDPVVTPFVPVVTPSGGRAGLPPGGAKPKIVWFTNRAPITGGGPIHVMNVFCGAPDCGASTRGTSPKSAAPAGLSFRPATSSKKKPVRVVVGSGKLQLRDGQSKPLLMYLNKVGKELLKQQGKLDIQTTVTVTSTGQAPVTAQRTIHVVLKKPTKKKH